MIQELLAKHKNYLLISGVVVLVFTTGYGTGRYLQPQKVVTTEKVVTVEKQVVVTQTQVQKVYLSDTATKTHRVEHEVKHPDGTDEKTTTTDQNIDAVVHDTQVQYIDRVVTVEKQVEVEKTKLVEVSKPSWRVGPLMGVNVADIRGLALDTGRLTYGAEVERRLLGPISVGAWGLTSGQVGLKLSLEF